ncbi:glyoxalase [Subtercola boreus]|uniref:Glyoxalase n=1 Tax=Subtercola boreus TaxID=120213 RepID=A0A3E0VN29_9MICO|nr:VOC family protein [Subtercola boreus]RFA11019.1 glyoxalase [Subtercola boreus]TQL55309.1 catechol 2,3-dioxygenase-like lactoylglutathione lyase family enzyme [Subtercola boreus]
MPVAAIDFAHLRLTVTDIARSRAFYDAVFGFDVLVEAPPADADAETKEKLAFVFGGVIYQFGGGVLGLRPVAPAHDVYDEDRVGLDHLSFAVAERSDLDDAVELLDGLGVKHEGVKDIGSGFILEFRDPDNIALELTAPKPAA